MLLHGLKMYLALLWGISALFSEGSMSASITETSSVNSTPDPNKTTKQLGAAHGVHDETVTPHPTVKPADVGVHATAETTAAPTTGTNEAIGSHRSDTTNDGMGAVVAASTASSSGPLFATVTTAADEAGPSHSGTTSQTAKSTEGQLHQQSPTTSAAGMTFPSATDPAASSATGTVSSPLFTTKPEATSHLSATNFPLDTSQTRKPSSEATPVSEPTSPPVSISETSTSSNELSSMSQPFSMTRTSTSTRGSNSTEPLSLSTNPTDEPLTISSTNSTAEPLTISSTNPTAEPLTISSYSANTTANVSTSPAGILIPHVPRKLPIPTTTSTPATTKASQSSPSTEVQHCSTCGLVKQCLIAISSLAGLATIFMVSTIILCTKLSARKYRVKKPQQATEMMCISALLPERNYTYTRQRNPVSNGVLVIHGGGDSDEDGGDNLTLSSFLPENDRFV